MATKITRTTTKRITTVANTIRASQRMGASLEGTFGLVGVGSLLVDVVPGTVSSTPMFTLGASEEEEEGVTRGLTREGASPLRSGRWRDKMFSEFSLSLIKQFILYTDYNQGLIKREGMQLP